MPAAHIPAENPLESAASQLRNICRDGEQPPSSFDAGSVARMLVHITNINSSVLASTQDHSNAAKRLNDFALTLDRVARNAEPPDGVLATRVTSIANTLRAASLELTGGNGLPKWQTSGTHRSQA